MPRVMKKPLRGSVRQNTMARANAEADEGGFRLSFGARLALMVLFALILLGFVSWSWHNRWPHRWLAAAQEKALDATRRAGFAVRDVRGEGLHYTDRAALLSALDVKAGTPIFAFDPQAAYDKIMALPWTESATVLRSLPDRIIVRLKEREPIARWQHNEKTIVIDRQGRELTAAKPEDFAALPLVVGNAAAEQTQSLLLLLADYPVVAKVLKAASRVGQRRWNFYIQPNLLIRMPEHNIEEAMKKLTQLIEEQKVTDRNVIAIDLRFPDRMVVEPGQQPTDPRYGETSE